LIQFGEEPTRPIEVEELIVEKCAKASITYLQVGLTHNGLGQMVGLPVMVARGARPGPVFGITSAVHGNEINGIPVIHRLFEALDLLKLRGTVVGVPVVNINGLLLGQRAFKEYMDLNTIFPGKPNGNDVQVFAHRFSERVLCKFNYLVDLHTASFGRVNSLYVRADLTGEITATMARLQRPEIILHNKASDGTMRGHAMTLGIPAITVEVGNPYRFHHEYIKSTLSGLKRVLSEVGMIPKRVHSAAPPPILCTSSYWLYADHGGILEVAPNVTDRVEKGQQIAKLSDIYGFPLRTYTAPEDGVVIGKSVHPVGQSGARILHLGIEGDPATISRE